MFALLLLYIPLPCAIGVNDIQVNSAKYDSVEECHCVPPHLCRDNDVAVNGQGLLDVRFEANQCPNYFDVCCENPAEHSSVPSSRPMQDTGCGIQSGMTSRIMSDNDKTQFGELPWNLVMLYREKESERRKYRCGASLIHPQVALTAAHCVFGEEMDELTIRAGEWDTKSQEEPMPHQESPVQDVLVHPNFHLGSLRNDVALLFLMEPLVITDNVKTICLPPPDFETTDNCIASGWGKDAYKKGRHSTVLKKVELPLVSRGECVKALRTTRLGAFYNLHRSFICAGGEEKKDTCKGDGGSPLICKVPGSSDLYVQVGIVSWGIGCGENVPGVYVNVAMYIRWIDKQLSSRGMDTNYYKSE